MRTYTNLAWPDDPYRASQQLYRRPSPMLAAFAVVPPGQSAATAPAAIAVAYLPLHRTRAITVTEGTLTFGFRAASTADGNRICRVAGVADLDLMQARRHARFLAGHALAADLHALREAAPGQVNRGLAAVESGWADRRQRARGTAAMIDLCDDGNDLAAISRQAGIMASPASVASSSASGDAAGLRTSEHLAAAAAERALTIALACARGLGQYRWEGTAPHRAHHGRCDVGPFPDRGVGRYTGDQPAC